VIGNFTGGGTANAVRPGQGQRYAGGNTGVTRLPRTGIFAAMDMATNMIRWRYRWPEQCYSGSIVTRGGLVFVGRNDGRLTALDSATGKQLWEFQTGAGMNSAASTFEHRGKQYVIAYSAGNSLIGSARGDSVWLFGLDGTLPPVERGTPQPRTTSAPVPNATPAARAGEAANAGTQAPETAADLATGAGGR